MALVDPELNDHNAALVMQLIQRLDRADSYLGIAICMQNDPDSLGRLESGVLVSPRISSAELPARLRQIAAALEGKQ